MKYEFAPQGVCPMSLSFDIDEEHKVTNIEFYGGCNGNLKAISKLVNGMTAEKISEILSGNTCGRRPTSCADQLSKAVMEAAGKI